MQKHSKATLLNHLKYHHFYYFYCLLWLGSITSEKFESEIKYEQNLKLQTIGAFLHLNKTSATKTILIPNESNKEPCNLGKIGLNFDIPSPTKFVNFFSFFEKLATNLKQTISNSYFETRPLA